MRLTWGAGRQALRMASELVCRWGYLGSCRMGCMLNACLLFMDIMVGEERGRGAPGSPAPGARYCLFPQPGINGIIARPPRPPARSLDGSREEPPTARPRAVSSPHLSGCIPQTGARPHPHSPVLRSPGVPTAAPLYRSPRPVAGMWGYRSGLPAARSGRGGRRVVPGRCCGRRAPLLSRAAAVEQPRGSARNGTARPRPVMLPGCILLPGSARPDEPPARLLSSPPRSLPAPPALANPLSGPCPRLWAAFEPGNSGSRADPSPDVSRSLPDSPFPLPEGKTFLGLKTIKTTK